MKNKIRKANALGMTEKEIDEESSSSDEEEITIRAKWTMDGATTLSEAIERLRGFIEYLRGLENEGWQLQNPICDDYGFLIKP